MAKRSGRTTSSKTLLFIIGAAVIGVAVLLIVLFTLIATGAVNATRTKLVFASGSHTFIYDGTEHTYEEWSIVDGELREGHTANVVVAGGRTDVGTQTNAISATISDGNGADVTDYYDIEYQPGIITVAAADLHLASADAEKVYDGTPLTAEEYSVIGGSIAEGQFVEATYNASVTGAGEVPNDFSARVVDSAGNDLSYNYNIILHAGTLKVTPRPVTLCSADAEKVYDGTPLLGETYEVAEGSIVEGEEVSPSFIGNITAVGEAENEFSAAVLGADGTDLTANYALTYLYGTLKVTPRPITVQSADMEKIYDGQPLSEPECSLIAGSIADGQELIAEAVAEQVNVGECENTFTVRIEDGEGEDVSTNYTITTVVGTLTVTPRLLSVQSESAEKVYDALPLTAEGYLVLEGSVAEGQRAECTYYASITDAGQTENDFGFIILDGEGEDVSSNYDLNIMLGTLKVTARPLTVQSNGAEKVYDGTALTAEGFTRIAGSFAEGQQGYSENYGAQTDAGESRNDFSFAVRDEYGTDVTRNYDITYSYGMLAVTPRPVTLRSSDEEKVYDGTPLTSSKVEVAVGQLVAGHEAELVRGASLTNADSIESSFAAAIKDEYDTDVTHNYDITYSYGTLTVTKRAITVQSADAEKEYDGTALCQETTRVVGAGVADGDTLQTAFTTNGITDVGEAQNTFSVRILRDGASVMGNYEIDYLYGTLKVTPRFVTLHSQDLEKVYDGTPLTGGEISVITGDLAGGHSVSAAVNGSLTNAGTADNKFTASIKDERGTDVTRNYTIEYSYGTLTVNKRPLVIQSSDADKVYDGTPLTYAGMPLTQEMYEVIAGNVADGQTLQITFTGEQTKVGDAPNAFSVRVLAGSEDVTHNYDLSETNLLFGTLTVNKRQVTIMTVSAEKVYDGEPLREKTYSISENNGLAEGHSVLRIEMPSEIVSAGTKDNEVASVVIIDGDGTDVTENYSFSYLFGTLTVYKREITVRSASASKVYDGTPLTDDRWEVVSITQAADGQTVQVAVSGERTEVGESDNTIAEVLITDGEGNNVSPNYTIKTEEGVLVVKEAQQQGGDEGGGGDMPDGGASSDGSIKGPDPDAPKKLALKVYSETDGQIYLRQSSSGDYTGAGWNPAAQYSQTLDGEFGMNYLTGAALGEAGYPSYAIRLDVAVGAYYLPYYPAMDTLGDHEIQSSDVKYQGDTSSIYSLSYYLFNARTATLLPSVHPYQQQELAYSQYVKNNYLSMGGASSELQAYLNEVIAEQGLNSGNIWAKISKVSNYIQTGAGLTYNLRYDRKLDEATDIVYCFLTDVKEGICQHYASAATLLFRALGIPARYTGGYVADAQAGKWVEVTNKEAHAWVEVYVDGVGWVNVEVTGGGPGAGGGTQGEYDDLYAKSYTVKPVTEYMKYDEKDPSRTLTPSDELQGLSAITARGFTYRAVVTGAQSEVGYGESTITSLTIFDPTGTDVTDKFKDITYASGTLHVYMAEITIATHGGTQVYDGTPLMVAGYERYGKLISGHTITIRTVGSQTNVGSSSNSVRYEILDAQGEDVSYMYKVNRQYNTLRVTPLSITVTAASDKKSLTELGGQALTNDGFTYEIEGGSLPKDYRVEAEVQGSQKNVGRSENSVTSVKIFDADGNDVSSNFAIETVNGVLSVTPPQ